MKIIISLILILFSQKIYGYEIIRDPIFENYFKELQIEYNLPDTKVYLVNSSEINAFVINNNVYFTLGILKLIKSEEVLKSILFHEVGHVYHNHFSSKKINVIKNKKKKIFNNLLSIGAAIITSNPNIGLATNVTIDQSLLRNLSSNSIKYEIQADAYMTQKIKKYKINTSQLINFFDNLPDDNRFYKSHPSNADRVIQLKKFSSNKIKENSIEFEWIKAKYNQNSNNIYFNSFFRNLKKGIIINNLDLIQYELINYEIYKSGLYIGDINILFNNLIKINKSPYLKIEFFNIIIDTNDSNNYFLIEKGKHKSDIQDEYFFYFLYGKYYDKVDKINLSNFYFCQFYKLIKFEDKSDYYCKRYDMKNILEIDESYAIFK